MAKASTKKKASKAPEKKSRAVIAGVLIAAVVIGAIALVMNVGSLAKISVEKVASHTLGAPVSIDDLAISLQEKQIRVTGVKVGNPAGYKQPYAAVVEDIVIAAEDIGQDLLVFNEIKVTGTMLNLEVAEGGTNFTTLRENARAHAGAAQQQDGAKLIIRSLIVEKAVLNPGIILTGTAPQPITLPDIRIRGIGEETNGVTAPQAIAEVVNYVVRVAVTASLQEGFLRGMSPESLRLVQEQLGIPPGFVDQIRDFGDRVKDIFSD